MPGMMPNAPVDVTIRGSMPPPSDHATAMRKTATVATLAVLLAATAGCKQKVVEPATGVAAPATSSSATADQDAGARASQVAPLRDRGAHRRDQGIGTHRFLDRLSGVLPGAARGRPDVERRGKRRAEGRCLCRRQGRPENHFGRGGPIGERQTGPWLRPG